MDTELSEQRVDQVSVYINAKLALLSPTHSGHCIFRVPNQLRKENEGAYEPIMLAIGPYHHGSNASEISLRASTNNVHHILGLVHGVWCSSFAEVLSQRKPENLKEDWEVIKCTTELQEAGVKFKKSSQTEIPFFDIKFENGVIEIPPLFISDDTERIFRNLIAYEQCSMSTCKKYFAHYSNFMDCLINSAKDVEKLRHKGIIVNALGDDEAVSSMFNKLCNHVMFTEPNYYSEVFENLNIHCGQRRNIWLANLRRNYFYSPWSVISFIAAAMLILFTFTQTIFSFLSYFKSKP